MEAKELRIGNWVQSNHEKLSHFNDGIFEIHVMHLVNMSDWYYLTSEVNPIPLTEEWLLKLGFKEMDTNEDGGHHFYLKGEFMLDSMFQHLETTYELKHVHQLQNLTHALTGEELTLKQ